jgi:hypothetical protein
VKLPLIGILGKFSPHISVPDIYLHKYYLLFYQKIDKIIFQEPKIFSIRKQIFISAENTLYTLYQLVIKEIKDSRVIILITRKNNISIEIRIYLMYNRDMIVIDVQEKTKYRKWKEKVSIANVYN